MIALQAHKTNYIS